MIDKLLAGLDDLAVHALLVAALARLGHDVLLDRRDVAADLRLVGRFGVVVDGLGAAVGQVLAVRGGAEGEFVARLLADLIPENAAATLTTVPGGWRSRSLPCSTTS